MSVVIVRLLIYGVNKGICLIQEHLLVGIWKLSSDSPLFSDAQWRSTKVQETVQVQPTYLLVFLKYLTGTLLSALFSWLPPASYYPVPRNWQASGLLSTLERGAKINLNYYYRCRFAESVLRDRNDAWTYLVLVHRRRLLSARKCVRKSKRLLEQHQLRGRRFNLLAVPIH